MSITFVELAIIAAVACLMFLLFSKGGRVLGALVLGALGIVFVGALLLVGLFAVTRVTSIRGPIVHVAPRWHESLRPPIEAPLPPAPSARMMVVSDGTVVSVETAPPAVPTSQAPQAEQPAVTVAPEEFSVAAPAQPAASGEPAVPAAEVESTAELRAIATPVPRPKPAWVEMKPTLDGGVYRIAVVSDPFPQAADCWPSLDQKISEAAGRYVQQVLGDDQAARRVHLPLSYLLERVKKDDWVETKDLSLGEHKLVHALLEFNDADREHIRALERQELRNSRLWFTLIGSGSVLLLLGTAFGYLKLDTLTKGYYSGRLRLAATAVAASVAALAYWLALDQGLGISGRWLR